MTKGIAAFIVALVGLDVVFARIGMDDTASRVSTRAPQVPPKHGRPPSFLPGDVGRPAGRAR